MEGKDERKVSKKRREKRTEHTRNCQFKLTEIYSIGKTRHKKIFKQRNRQRCFIPYLSCPILQSLYCESLRSRQPRQLLFASCFFCCQNSAAAAAVAVVECCGCLGLCLNGTGVFTLWNTELYTMAAMLLEREGRRRRSYREIYEHE